MTVARLPYSVDFRPIGQCNLRCPFCFGPRHHVPSMNRDDALRIIDIIAEFGAKCVVLSGGEPTLLPYLAELLQRAKARRLMTVLSSNGLLLGRLIDTIAPSLDWLALPLDGPDRASNAAMRVGNNHHFATILSLIPRIQRKYPALRIKLGTVVTRHNYMKVPPIIRRIAKKGLPDTWKLYQVSPSNYGRDNYNWLSIPDQLFVQTVGEARRTAAEYGIRVAVYSNRDRDGKYLFIDPTGDALIISDCDEVTIGNILVDPNHVMETWPSFIDERRLEKNIQSTYLVGAWDG